MPPDVASRIGLGSRLVAAPGILCSRVGEEAVLLDRRSGDAFGLDAVGARVWDHVQAPEGVAALRDALLEEFAADPPRLEADLLALLDELAARSLVRVLPPGPSDDPRAPAPASAPSHAGSQAPALRADVPDPAAGFPGRKQAPGGAWPVERALLLACARTDALRAPGGLIQELLAREPHWPTVLTLVTGQGVTGLLSETLGGEEEGPAAGAVPEQVRRELRARHRAAARANLRLSRHLLDLLDAAEARSLPVLPFKGPVLASRAYGDVSLRTFSDLDLLVREGDLELAHAVLREAGLEPSPGLGNLSEKAVRRWVNAYPFRTADGMPVELHWRISDAAWQMNLDMEGLWARARRHDWMGRPVLGLSPEDQVHVLCLHAARHAWSRLVWVADVAETMRGEAVEWDSLLDRAGESGTRRMVLVGAGLAHRLLGAPLPAEIVRRVEDNAAVRNLLALVEGLLAGREVWAGAEFLFHLRNRDRLRDRLGFLAGSLLSPTEEDLRGMGPGSSLRWRQVRRPFRLAWKYWDQRRRTDGWTWERE